MGNNFSSTTFTINVCLVHVRRPDDSHSSSPSPVSFSSVSIFTFSFTCYATATTFGTVPQHSFQWCGSEMTPQGTPFIAAPLERPSPRFQQYCGILKMNIIQYKVHSIQYETVYRPALPSVLNSYIFPSHSEPPKLPLYTYRRIRLTCLVTSVTRHTNHLSVQFRNTVCSTNDPSISLLSCVLELPPLHSLPYCLCLLQFFGSFCLTLSAGLWPIFSLLSALSSDLVLLPTRSNCRSLSSSPISL